MTNVFDICRPRDDVLQGAIKESDFAADLAQVLRGDAPPEYRDPERFFANTYPTRGLKSLLRNVSLRLADRPEQIGAVFRLDTQFGGGKTHALIALAHALRSGSAVPGMICNSPATSVTLAPTNASSVNAAVVIAVRKRDTTSSPVVGAVAMGDSPPHNGSTTLRRATAAAPRYTST